MTLQTEANAELGTALLTGEEQFFAWWIYGVGVLQCDLFCKIWANAKGHNRDFVS